MELWPEELHRAASPLSTTEASCYSAKHASYSIDCFVFQARPMPCCLSILTGRGKLYNKLLLNCCAPQDAAVTARIVRRICRVGVAGRDIRWHRMVMTKSAWRRLQVSAFQRYSFVSINPRHNKCRSKHPSSSIDQTSETAFCQRCRMHFCMRCAFWMVEKSFSFFSETICEATSHCRTHKNERSNHSRLL